MYKIRILGARRLSGSTRVHGAKNSVLPILAGTVLGEGESVITDCPYLSDVEWSLRILESVGCNVKWEGGAAIVDASCLTGCRISDFFMHKMRSSITFLGALVARCGEAEMSFPGGCALGPRPIDIHIRALRDMGICVAEKCGNIKATRGHYRGGTVNLDFPSVGATENVMMAATLAKGETIIKNAAKEPEIWDLQNFLNKMGAKISGAGTDEIRILGVNRLSGCTHRVIPDRIVAATYLCAGAASGGDVFLENVEPNHLLAVLSALEETGAALSVSNGGIRLYAPKRPKPIKLLRTMPYPGFPTDAQAPVTALLCTADGVSCVEETIFENRFRHFYGLGLMGADIKTHGGMAIIRGVPALTGAKVEACELRGGAALVVAGLGAEGETIISGTSHIDRGYASLVEDMQSLGADIKKVF